MANCLPVPSLPFNTGGIDLNGKDMFEPLFSLFHYFFLRELLVLGSICFPFCVLIANIAFDSTFSPKPDQTDERDRECRERKKISCANVWQQSEREEVSSVEFSLVLQCAHLK